MSKFEKLMYAIKDGKLKNVKDLIRIIPPEELNKKQHNLYGETVLHQAAYFLKEEIFILLMNNVDNKTINSLDHSNRTPLLRGLESGMINEKNIELAQLLISKMTTKALEARENHLLYSVLHVATSKNYLEICKILIKASPRLVNFETITFKTPLDMAAAFAKNYEIAKLIIEHGGNIGNDDEMERHYMDRFKPMLEASKIIDNTFHKKECCLKFKIEEDLYDIMFNRFKYKLIKKYGDTPKAEIYEKYELFLPSMQFLLPQNLYNKIIDIIKPAKLTSILERPLEKPLESLKLFAENDNNFNPEQDKLNFLKEKNSTENLSKMLAFLNESEITSSLCGQNNFNDFEFNSEN